MRIGWDEEHIFGLKMLKLLSGRCTAVAVHGRTRVQMYEGKANWDYIRQVKENVSIPVLGNGDVETPQDAKRMLETTGVDAVMIDVPLR